MSWRCATSTGCWWIDVAGPVAAERDAGAGGRPVQHCQVRRLPRGAGASLRPAQKGHLCPKWGLFPARHTPSARPWSPRDSAIALGLACVFGEGSISPAPPLAGSWLPTYRTGHVHLHFYLFLLPLLHHSPIFSVAPQLPSIAWAGEGAVTGQQGNKSAITLDLVEPTPPSVTENFP
ncbi:hypothetical protein DL89DRAFT_18713 [Linderina pennispora]|uniref:Uncharacterized protein n=1 Tax=Linderina pennispora TaxID=61395 RepID=A0A1Y1WML7_9FUNG|nr:uncharacterized protein DL89DRAFT_18713 [Linderina pennispora]ORX74548.1 hypothetical protein DL89DRAFT_18713 [Linderina pennispora]